MNTKQIDYILEIAQTKNFNRAAENLFISQPTLSYQIKLIEDEVGFLIFERSVRGAVLTPAGEQLYFQILKNNFLSVLYSTKQKTGHYFKGISVFLSIILCFFTPLPFCKILLFLALIREFFAIISQNSRE